MAKTGGFRHSACGKKVSFTHRAKAEKVAKKHGQTVYECPVCFCYHCTSKEDWRSEFVSIEKYEAVRAIADDVEQLRRDLKEKHSKKVQKIIDQHNKAIANKNTKLSNQHSMILELREQVKELKANARSNSSKGEREIQE